MSTPSRFDAHDRMALKQARSGRSPEPDYRGELEVWANNVWNTWKGSFPIERQVPNRLVTGLKLTSQWVTLTETVVRDKLDRRTLLTRKNAA